MPQACPTADRPGGGRRKGRGIAEGASVELARVAKLGAPVFVAEMGRLAEAPRYWPALASALDDAAVLATFSSNGSVNLKAGGDVREQKVLRGGSWRTIATGTQSSYRKAAPGADRRDSVGFRCAR